MRVESFVPDVAPVAPAPQSEASFSNVLDGIGVTLDRAQSAEDAFAAKRGSLQEAIYERARADVALAVATAVAQHAAQAVQSVLNMQI